MPSLTSLPHSLSEILEAHKGPLRELEIWALLWQCAEALQDMIIQGEAVGDEAFRRIVTPNNLLIRDNGTIVLTQVTQDLHSSPYVAPELESNMRQFVSDTAFEKMFVFSLGRTLQVASEYGLSENEVLSISYDLDSLLQAMSERNAAVRLSLMHVLEACTLQVHQHPNKPAHTYTLSRLYKTLLRGSMRSSFQDSSYGSDNSQQSTGTVNFLPGRARRPRPHVRHRYDTQRLRTRSRSRSRSRSHSPVRDGQDSGFLTLSQQDSIPTLKTDHGSIGVLEASGCASSASTTVQSSQFLNTSLASSGSDRMEFGGRHFQAMPYAAAHSVQGLLGLRQGSPAYQKYILLKERQFRLRQARSGQPPSALNDVRSRLMTPTLMSHEMLDDMSENRSMASLMSYSLGTYKPDLYAQYGSAAALRYGHDLETEVGSQPSLMLGSGEYSDPLRSEETPTGHPNPGTNVTLSQQGPEILQEQPWQNEKQSQPLKLEPKLAQTVAVQQKSDSRPTVQSTERAPLPLQKLKEFYGPEYLFKSKQPAIRIVMPHSGDSQKNASMLRKLFIVHLTGQMLEVALDPSTTGQQLFNTVIPYLYLDDIFFFGLTFISEGEHFFLDADTKLHKIAPDGWKDGPKGQAISVTFALYVRVKYYPESLTDFRHPNSYHLLYLQLRRDVLEERVTCGMDVLSQLAGLAVQAEYGNHDQAVIAENTFLPEHYISSQIVKRYGAEKVMSFIVREYKKCAGVPETQAEIEYIKHVRHLPEYGIHFHRLFKNKSNTDTFIWLGLSQNSLFLAEPKTHGRTILQDYSWNSILKISFNKRRFSIQPKVEVNRGKQRKLNFYTNSYRKGRYLLQFSTDQHRFQLRMRSRPSNLETLAGNFPVEMKAHTVDTGVGDFEIGDDMTVESVLSSYVDPSQQPLPDDEDNDDDIGERKSATASQHPLQYRSPPPYKPPRMTELLAGLDMHADFRPHLQHDPLADLSSTKHQMQALLDQTCKSSGQDSALISNTSGYEEPSPPYTSSLFTSRHTKFGRRVFEATLEKEGALGIGLTIVGGETTSSLDLGIFIKSVLPGGPADRDGRIMPGDRLIAIGGVSLEGKQHQEAVAMIRDGGPRITLLISQIRPPGTIKKKNAHDEQAEFEKKLRSSILEYSDSKSGWPSLSEGSINDLETFLRFDDFVDNICSNFDRNIVCNSDEENFPLEPPLLSSSRLLSTHVLTSGDSTIPNKAEHSTESQQAHFNSPPFTQNKTSMPHTAQKTDTSTIYPVIAGTHFVSHDDQALQGSLKERGVDRQWGNAALHNLRDVQEINFEGQVLEWPDIAVLQTGSDCSIPGMFGQSLESLDRDHLQMIEDLAALEADDSSSDSDFDTAVKKTIEGSGLRIREGKSINILSPGARETLVKQNMRAFDPAAIVIYEVVLESQNSSLGIITNTLGDPDFPASGVFIKKILPGSSAEKGGILASGDRILEISGQNVERYDSKAVQAMLNSASDMATVKVSRTLHKDALMTRRPGNLISSDDADTTHNLNLDLSYHQPHHHGYSQHPGADRMPTSGSTQCPPKLKDKSKTMSISKLITSAPRERTQPLPEDIQIVPPPPPLSPAIQDSGSSTQSDMDSDVFDSSRSELESTYSKVTATPRLAERQAPIKPKRTPDKNTMKTSEKFPDTENSGANKLETLSLANSVEFNEQLSALKTALDERLGSEKTSSGNSSVSSVISFTDPAIRPAIKLVEDWQKSLIRQPRIDSDDDDDDDSSDVVAFFGDEPDVEMKGTLSSESLEQIVNKKYKGEKPAETQGKQNLGQKQLLESEILEVSLKKDGVEFGFTVAGGVSTGGCYIKQLVCDPAVADGRLRPGDKILKVNGHDVTNMGHVEAVTLLRSLPSVVSLVLRRCPQEEQFTVFSLELPKPRSAPAHLGIRLTQQEINGRSGGIFVKKLKIDGAADKDGRLQAGDRILQANGISFDGLTKREAQQVLKDAVGKVLLLVSRFDPDKSLCDNDSGKSGDEIESRQCYVSPRKQELHVPVIMSQEWLRELPLMYKPRGKDDKFAGHLLQCLSDMVQMKEPEEEFKNLCQMKETGPSNVGKLAENKVKNRYRNVLPYDDNRVKLLNSISDYINASYISVKVGDFHLQYIVCQGPVMESVSDFWKMVWQEEVRVIAMLTELVEGGKVKCHAYWPQTKEKIVRTNDGKLVVTLIRSYQVEEFSVMNFYIEEKDIKSVREITHIQFTSWPDHGVPESGLPLLRMLQVIHLLEHGAPAVIHCSAGIGRTGAIIAIDVALATIEHGLQLDLYEIVRSLRSQRYGMVQTMDQYVFCYRACMEALLSLLGD